MPELEKTLQNPFLAGLKLGHVHIAHRHGTVQAEPQIVALAAVGNGVPVDKHGAVTQGGNPGFFQKFGTLLQLIRPSA